jgi:hypothetical protein
MRTYLLIAYTVGTAIRGDKGITLFLDPNKSVPAGARLFLTERRKKEQQTG